jgi:hypothetical protein
MSEPSPDTRQLELSLLELHASVARLIRVIGENSPRLNENREILDKLPLLYFYNDDLLRHIRLFGGRSPGTATSVL